MIACKKEETPQPSEETKETTPVINPDEKMFYRVNIMNSENIVGEKVEFALFEKEETIGTKYNPYDYNQIKVTLNIISPTGEQQEVSAFWYQDYNITLNTYGSFSISGINGIASTDPNEVQGMELVNPVGTPHYRVRYTPVEAGEYSYAIRIYLNNEFKSQENDGKFTVKGNNSPYKGIITVDESNNKFFKFSGTNETFMGVGQNACWYTSSTRKTEDYGVWFEYFKENNMNLTRIWMALWGFSLHYDSIYDFSKRYSQAARLDKLIEYAEEYDIYLSLCLLDHGQFSSTVNSRWDENPYNSKNGGILDEPFLFFTSGEARQVYKNELLYIISRYGYSNKVFCWELFNEVDWCDNYSLITVRYRDWHKEMATFIKANDSFNHLVSTSFRGTDGLANGLEEIDFVMPHDYSYTNKNIYTAGSNTLVQLIDKYDKPAFFGEIGLNSSNGNENKALDGNGVSLHQMQWMGIMSSSAGAMNWWWDSYVHPNKLYYRYKGAGAYAKLMNLSGSDYTRLQTLAYTISNDNLNLLGHAFNNRIYGYLYDKAWTYYNTNIVSKNNVTLTIPFTNGSYVLTLYNTSDGEIISNSQVEAKDGKITITIPSVQYDIAFIIE